MSRYDPVLYCELEDCLRPHHAKNLCERHYRRLQRLGKLTIDNDNRSKHPLYITYKAMVARCSNPSINGYHNYGGRGIRVCERWLGRDGFWNFVEDMGIKPEGTTLDRIDNDGNYEPYNTRWATPVEQRSNQRKQHERI